MCRIHTATAVHKEHLKQEGIPLCMGPLTSLQPVLGSLCVQPSPAPACWLSQCPNVNHDKQPPGRQALEWGGGPHCQWPPGSSTATPLLHPAPDPTAVYPRIPLTGTRLPSPAMLLCHMTLAKCILSANEGTLCISMM